MTETGVHPMPKTKAQISAEFYKRKIAAGWRLFSMWTKAENVAAIKEFAKRLIEK